MSLTKEKIISDYNYFKSKAIFYCQEGIIEKSIKFIELAARIGYRFNFRYTDDELESTIYKLGLKILPKSVTYTGKANKIVFYDSFALDNRNLTIQYLRAIFNWDSDLLYITNKSSIGQNISNELKLHSNSTVYIVTGDSFEERIKRTAEVIKQFEPETAFLQYLPWDVFGFTLWSQIISSERFFINLTDHAFWLGKNTADYFLEFRKFGCSLSLQYRGIPANKLLFQHYYPISTKTRFAGFPVEKNNKIFAFSGSNYYKIYGKDFLYLKLMKEVLDKNKNLVLLFAGNGNSRPLLNFIKKNNLQDRFILIGNRHDLSEVFERIDIYVNTYPMIGGLMTQYAAIYNKPIIGYSDPINKSFNDSEDFLGIEQKELIAKSSTTEFVNYFNLLINSLDAREENIRFTLNSVISENGFNDSLKQTILLKNNSDFIKGADIAINVNEIFDIYFDMEENYMKEHYYSIFYTLKFYLLSCKFSIIFNSFVGAVLKKIKIY